MTLCLGLLATFASWRLVDHLTEDRENLRFEHEVDGLTGNIRSRLTSYSMVIRGATGLFRASESVGQDEFRAYYDTLRLPDNYAGFLNLGYAVSLSSGEEVADHAARMRREEFPQFTIHPHVPGDEHAIVTLIEPLDSFNRGALGFDGMSNEAGQAAMQRARDTGRASLSAPTPLRRNQEGLEASLIMFLPLYHGGVDPGTVESRRAALRGFVFGGLRLNELMAELQSQQPTTRLAIYDMPSDGEPIRLFDGRPEGTAEGRRTAVRAITFGGREWSLRFSEPRSTVPPVSQEPVITAAIGIVFSLILFVFTLFLARMEQARRESAEALLDTEKKLRQAQKMEAIGQLTGGVAHDFNNLLQVILGNTELLLEQSKPGSNTHRLAEMTQRAAERGAELTSRLLAFARRQALHPRPTDVNQLINGMETLIHRALGETVNARIIHDPALKTALVDPSQLESALLNLCINARDAMPEGGHLTVETLNVTMDEQDARAIGDIGRGDYVRISVRDTGHGMDKATMAQAFEPFFTTKEVGKGSGLGLSMVFGFVKQSNGHVEISSAPGQGTTVRLYLPACPDSRSQPHAPDDRSTAEGGSGTILMVEDNALVRSMTEAQLRSLGYDVIVASRGQEALDILRSNRPCDLLFTDLVMPGGVDGHQLAAAARHLRPDLPVLFTTGYGGKTASANRNSQSIRTLQKPYRRQDLAEEIRLLLLWRSSRGKGHRRI